MSHSRNFRSLTLSNASLNGPPSFLNGPPSPTMTATTSLSTSASQLNLSGGGPEVIVTRKDLRESQNVYEALVADAHHYRETMKLMATAAARFANSMERCARLKGVEDETGARLQAVGGLHHLMANHWEVLSASIQASFEAPLRNGLGSYREAVTARTAGYEKAILEKSKLIKQIEADNFNRTRKRQRDLQSFRNSLALLQSHVDDLDNMKATHYQEILDYERQTWEDVSEKTGLVARLSLEVFDRLSSKSADPALQPFMTAIPDPFESYGPPRSQNDLISVLQPLGLAPLGSASTIFSPTSPTKLISAPSPASAFMPGSHAWVASPTPEGQFVTSSFTSYNPTGPVSPTRSGAARSSSPQSMRRVESKLRSVLSGVDEVATPSNGVNGISGDHTSEERAASWSRDQNQVYGIKFPSSEKEKHESSEATTPRNTSLTLDPESRPIVQPSAPASL